MASRSFGPRDFESRRFCSAILGGIVAAGLFVAPTIFTLLAL